MFIKAQKEELRDCDRRIVLGYHLFLGLGIWIIANQGLNVFERDVLELGRVL